jgi:hypothetical protein
MIESNQRQVNIPEFIAIAEAVGANPADLFRLYSANVVADSEPCLTSQRFCCALRLRA